MGYSSAHLVTSTLRTQIRLQHPNSSEPGHVPHCWRAHSPAPAPSLTRLLHLPSWPLLTCTLLHSIPPATWSLHMLFHLPENCSFFHLNCSLISQILVQG